MPIDSLREENLCIIDIESFFSLHDIKHRICNELTDSELEQMGHDRKTGRIRLLHALETVDALADYSEEAATEEFGNYMDANFPNVTFKPEFVNPRAARWCGM